MLQKSLTTTFKVEEGDVYMLKFTWNYVKKQKMTFFILAMMTSISYVVSIVFPYYNGVFIDILTNAPTINSIKRMTIVICALGIAGIVFNYISSILIAKFINILDYEVVSEQVAHIQKMPIESFTSGYNATQLLQRINTDSHSLNAFISDNILKLILNAFKFVILFLLLLNINIMIILLTLVLLPIYFISYILTKKYIYENNKSMKEENTIFFKRMHEQLNQIYSIKADAAYEISKNILNKNFKKYLKSIIKNTHSNQIFLSLDGIITIIFQIGVLSISGVQIINGKMTIGQYTVVNTYFIMLLNVIKYYFSVGQAYQEAKASYDRIVELNNIETESNGDQHINTVNDIFIDKFRFKYRDSDKIFIQPNYHFMKNKIYYISGANGIGKTTLINIIIGLLQNTEEGNIRYNDTPINRLDMYETRRMKISIHLQNNNLPDYNVEEFLVSILNMDISTIARVIYEKKLDKLFLSSSFNYKEFLDKSIISLSGGERQKVLLMKSLIKSADVLILDEPTAGLDQMSIELLNKILAKNKNGKITIVTDHTGTIEQIADEIIYLNEPCL